jgi:histidinol-phosphate aminotransferase
MIDINDLVRENVKSLVPYSCARDEFEGSEGIFMDANENPFGHLNRYPDPYQRELKKAISQNRGIEENRIFLGNGSDEVIDLTYRIFCKPGAEKALIFPPTYGMYEVSAAINDVGIVKIPLNDDFQINMNEVRKLYSDRSLKLIFICSPNNPTGNCMNREDIEEIVSSFRGMVVVDEAYIDFTEKPSAIELTKKYPNILVMQTFSKAKGLAAVRIGMAFADQSVIPFFNKMKPPYNISTINQREALRRLGKTSAVSSQVKRIISERERLIKKLQEIPHTQRVYPSDSNFLLVKVKNADLVYKKLVGSGIVVRNRSSVLNNCIRITVGKRSENEMFLKAFKSITL